MQKTATLTNYDINFEDFDRFRQPNPSIMEMFDNAFSPDVRPIISVGCGTGQYEHILSGKMSIVGLDKSGGMINKAKERISDLVQGDMISLPFKENSFSGAYMMQSLHHVGANLNINSVDRNVARKQALKEVVRVVDQGPIFVVQRDPSQNQAVWFWKFFPRALAVKMKIQPEIAVIKEWFEDLGLEDVSALPIFDPMIKGFFNPYSPLDPGFRRSFSEFSYLTDQDIEDGLKNLRKAIESGSVMDDIEACKLRFAQIGGTVFVVSGKKV